jgi:uncharacterized protein YgbK (DUF1537 family)
LEEQDLWRPKDEKKSGLVIAGSYVQKTTAQLKALLEKMDCEDIQLSIGELLSDDTGGTRIALGNRIEQALRGEKIAVVYTEREYALRGNAKENAAAGNQISMVLASIVSSLKEQPGFICAKGGITSHDIAQQGLNVNNAMVLGQILPGVPVWQLGEDSKFPGMQYIVFPGNVGDDDSLLEAVQIMAGQP